MALSLKSQLLPKKCKFEKISATFDTFTHQQCALARVMRRVIHPYRQSSQVLKIRISLEKV